MGFRVLVSLHPAIQATGRLTFAPAGLIPAEHTSLRWTHKRVQSLALDATYENISISTTCGFNFHDIRLVVVSTSRT